MSLLLILTLNQELSAERDELLEANQRWIEYKDAIDAHIAELQEMLSKKDNELNDKAQSFNDMVERYETLNHRFKQLESQQQREISEESDNWKRQLREATEEISHLKKQLDNKELLLLQVSEGKDDTVESFNRRLNHLNSLLQEKDRDIEVLESEIRSVQALLRDSEEEKARLRYEQSYIDKSAEGLKPKPQFSGGNERDLMDNIADLKTQLEEKTATNHQLNSQLLSLQRQYRDAQNSIEDLRGQLKFTRDEAAEYLNRLEQSRPSSRFSSPSATRYGTPATLRGTSVSELQLKLASAEHQIESLRTEAEGFRNKLEFKSNRLDEVSYVFFIERVIRSTGEQGFQPRPIRT